MRILYFCVVFLTFFSSTDAHAAPSEANERLLKEIHGHISTSISRTEQINAEDGQHQEEWFRVSIKGTSVYSVRIFAIDTGELVRCIVMYISSRSKVNHYYFDNGCDGSANYVATKDGQVLARESAADTQYLEVLELVLPAFRAASQFNKNIPNVRFTLLYDWDNVNATHKEMQTALLKIEQFPNFDYDRPYSFGVWVNDDGFFFDFNINRSRMQVLNCKIIKYRGEALSAAWLDERCDGAFEWEDPDGDSLFQKPKSEGSEIASKMKAYMEQVHRFVVAYQSLLKLPE